MIIRRLRLHPWGCFADRELAFEPGLNVLYGPNEAGKSTVFHAMRTLLLRTRLDKRDAGQYIARFLPAGGGDTVRLSAAFELPEGTVTLRRRWGPSPASELSLPDGVVIREDEAVKARLESLLPARHASFWRILFTSQTELSLALDELRRMSEPLSDLDDVLRRSVLATGGVSPDRFRGALERAVAEACDNWDLSRAAPRGNRGLDNPWKKNVGTILAAFYEREGIARALKLATEVEKAIDEANTSLLAARETAGRAGAFLEANRKAHDDARDRGALEATIRAVQAAGRELTTLAREWPVAESKAAEMRSSMAAGAERVARLRGDREAAALAEEARAAASAVERERAGLEAAAMEVTLTARKAVEIAFEREPGSRESLALEAGQTRSLGAAGRLVVAHPDVTIEIRTGGADAASRRAALDGASSRLSALEARMAERGTPAPARELATVAAELAAAERDAAALAREVDAKETRLRELEAAHGSVEALLGKLGDAKAEEREASKKLEACAPLPDGYADAASFLEAYEKARQAERHEGDRIAEARERRARLEERLPAESAEELRARLEQSDARFQAAMRRGAALLRLKEATSSLLSASDAAIYEGMREEIGRSMATMTGERWSSVALEGALPSAMVSRSGARLAWEQLSAGTRDLLALALRLAMASRLLGDARGFAAMDDPLVEMDPARQKAAAAALRSFAEHRQLIVLTCHPAHAELLGGARITL
jgi:DNA repair protein SbcC/Rad50